MALPTDIQTGTVTGKYTKSDGTPAQGTVVFNPAAKYVVSPVTKTTVTMDPVTATLAADGTFSATLIASNDPDMVPTGWTWDATVNLVSGTRILTQAFDLDPGETLDITGFTSVQTNLGTAPAFAGTGPAQWSTLVGKPAVVAAGADQGAARASIGAGTSNLALGNTSSTAKAGNDPGDFSTLNNKPTTYPPSAHTHTLDQISGTTTFTQQFMASSTDLAARQKLGGTSVGSAVFTATDAAGAQNAIGLTGIGAQIAALQAAIDASPEYIIQSGGTYPAPVGTKARIIIGTVEPSTTLLRSGTNDIWLAR